ncbi:MAG TPA: VacJ family lipoprotein [Methylophaga sp.]|nr:VacJ family lipoprotein [Methylophaga sp.]
MPSFTSLLKVSLLAVTVLLSACATTQHAEEVNDPWEGYNRTMYSFNDTLDRFVAKPIAKGYDAVLPDAISQGVTNFFSNLLGIQVVFNDLLQFKFSQAADDAGYFLLNTTVGVLGIFDVAGHAGYKRGNEDFGQTLGAWGVGQGPYVVLPIIGPSTVRDGTGLLIDFNVTDPIAYIDHVPTRNRLYGAYFVDTRANLLGLEKVLDEAALDEYSYVRDAYLQRRQNLVYDGDPPEEDFDVFEDD